MDSEGRIYRAPEAEIPVEDKARLEGYLQGKVEQTEKDKLVAELERLRAELDR